MVKNRCILGPQKDDLKEIVLLGRRLRWEPGTAQQSESLTWEGDVRHIDILAQHLGMTAGKTNM